MRRKWQKANPAREHLGSQDSGTGDIQLRPAGAADASVSPGKAVAVSAASSAMRDLARQLFATGQPGVSPGKQGVLLVNDNLRRCIAEFAGADGFGSLLRRASTLASRQFPALREARVGVDGRVEGLEQAFVHDETMLREAAVAVTVQLLDLLVTFLGEPLARRLVREALESSPGK